MTRTWRFPVALALSIIFAAPVLGDALMNAGDLLGAGVQYLAALGLAWAGVTFITRLVDSYAMENHAAEQAALLEERLAEIEATRAQREEEVRRAAAEHQEESAAATG